MKRLAFLLSMGMLFGCASVNRIEEDTMYKTRQYCGEYVSQKAEKHRYSVTTTEAIFHLQDGPIDVPMGVRCYFQLREERLPGSTGMVWIIYFTWDGTDKEYKVCQNFITGEIL